VGAIAERVSKPIEEVIEAIEAGGLRRSASIDALTRFD